MKFIASTKVKDERLARAAASKSGLAEAIKAQTNMLVGLIRGIAGKPAPKVENRVSVRPTPVTVKVNPDINIDGPEPHGWTCEVVSRDNRGNIRTLEFTPIIEKKPRPRRGSLIE